VHPERAGPALRGVLHPVVITPDLPRALAFYRDLLGFRVHAEMTHDPVALARLGGPRDARASAVILRAPDGSEIEIASFAAPRGKPRSDSGWPDAGIRSITFVVDGLDALLVRLAAAGHPALGETVPFDVDGGPVRVAYARGPDGVVLTLLEHVPANERTLSPHGARQPAACPGGTTANSTSRSSGKTVRNLVGAGLATSTFSAPPAKAMLSARPTSAA